MSFRRGFKADANRIALRIREKMGLSPIDPINPFEVCTIYDIPVIPLSEIDPNSTFLKGQQNAFSAVTIPCDHRTAIVHNDAHHPYRQRSNVSHELAHCFLGHQCSPPLTESGERSRDSGLEAEANFLAGALLIPNEAARHIVSNGMIESAQQLYGVSQAMLTYRLRISGANEIHARRMRRGR